MRLITDVLRDIRRGKVVDAASDELAAVVRACLDTEKPGELILKIKIKPRKDDNALIVTTEIKSKRPQPDMPDALFFANLEGDLLRDDPTQTRMFTETVETVDPKTGEVLSA